MQHFQNWCITAYINRRGDLFKMGSFAHSGVGKCTANIFRGTFNSLHVLCIPRYYRARHVLQSRQGRFCCMAIYHDEVGDLFVDQRKKICYSNSNITIIFWMWRLSEARRRKLDSLASVKTNAAPFWGLFSPPQRCNMNVPVCEWQLELYDHWTCIQKTPVGNTCFISLLSQ